MACSRMFFLVCLFFICLYFVSNNLITGLKQEQPGLYDNLTTILNPVEKQIIEAVFHEADTNALAAQEQAAAAAMAAGVDGGQ